MHFLSYLCLCSLNANSLSFIDHQQQTYIIWGLNVGGLDSLKYSLVDWDIRASKASKLN